MHFNVNQEFILREKSVEKFSDLQVGTIFQVCDGRVSESSSWITFIKISEQKAKILRPKEGKEGVEIPKDFQILNSGFRGLLEE